MAKEPKDFNGPRTANQNRKPFARVLIVCEGKKTEPYYLKELVRDLRVATTTFSIIPEGGDPSAIVERAIVSAESDGEYDYVFCVFDRDTHEWYAAACSRCRAKKLLKEDGTQIHLVAITSNPSFEYWLLLHLAPTTKPYKVAGKKSSGAQALADFAKVYKAQLKGRYEKGTTGVYASLREKLDDAIVYSNRANRAGLDNPHTLMGALVLAMRKIANGEHPNVSAIKNLRRGSESV